MAFAGWWAHPSEWMVEPHSVGPLNLSLRQRLRDLRRELRITPPPPQQGLPMDAQQSRRLTKRVTLRKKA
jgi:hypothetical protein